MTHILPAGLSVFERGWLSSNNILFHDGRGRAALVDTGYVTHASQTVSLVETALRGRPLDLLLNTHLHSDHCGGNAALQERYPDARCLIPPGQAEAVRIWDTVALTYAPTGQACPRFGFEGILAPGTSIELGAHTWEVHASPGHDPHSVVLFEPGSRILISADALWANGFGVVFPELEGEKAFDAVASTLDLIERLCPSVVIPGHGPVFGGDEVLPALQRARSRLEGFMASPPRHARHAAKVLMKFRLLDWQRIALGDFLAWAETTPYLLTVAARYFPDTLPREWLATLVDELVRAGAATLKGDMLENA